MSTWATGLSASGTAVRTAAAGVSSDLPSSETGSQAFIQALKALAPPETQVRPRRGSVALRYTSTTWLATTAKKL